MNAPLTPSGHLETTARNQLFYQFDDIPIREPHVLTAGEPIKIGAYEFQFDGTQLIPIPQRTVARAAQ